jgi:hypothetical protein
VVVAVEKVTAPVGTPTADVTVAVSVTDAPYVIVVGEVVTVVVVAKGPTRWAWVAEVAGSKKPAPAYTQASAWLPEASTTFPSVQEDDVPVLETGEEAVPSVAAPSRNDTEPAGAPPADETTHVRVTASPFPEGFGAEDTAAVVVPLTSWASPTRDPAGVKSDDPE